MQDNTSRSKRRVFIYGNYPNYKRYRFADQEGIDARLIRVQEAIPLLFKATLHNGCCLDIGCNTGALTRDLVKHFGVRHVTGVDIDGSLISRAVSEIPLYQTQRFEYIQEDYVSPSVATSSGEFDAIFCLSVTKWVQLHGGDVAIIRLLDRIERECKAGGLLILEPQSWESYRRKKNLTNLTAQNYLHLRLRPHDFVAYMQKAHRFSLAATISPSEDVAKGFQRIIYVLQKDTQS